jgi:hypothetical protein
VFKPHEPLSWLGSGVVPCPSTGRGPAWCGASRCRRATGCSATICRPPVSPSTPGAVAATGASVGGRPRRAAAAACTTVMWGRAHRTAAGALDAGHQLHPPRAAAATVGGIGMSPIREKRPRKALQSGFGPTTFQRWRSKNLARSASFIACRSASSSMRPPAAAGV